jgi:rhamnulokinase
MKKPSTHLAIDMGAESGRAILGWMEDGALQTQEVHRFPNRPVQLPDGLRWNTLGLFDSVQESIRLAGQVTGEAPDSVGICTWGVDYGLVDRRGALVGVPYHYRDSRTEGMIDFLLSQVSRERVYGVAGLQFVPYNTLIQLLAAQRSNPEELERAETLLLTPDLFSFWLTGRREAEYTMAATTQCMRAGTREWATDLLEELGLPSRLLPPIGEPGTIRGVMAQGTSVVAVASHDTASAAAAVPAVGDDFVWISSGTWSIMGVDAETPSSSAQAMEWNFTNEGSAAGGIRLCKNIMGLWLVQECRRVWRESGKDYSYSDLMLLAEEADPGIAVVDPDQEAFLRPGDMPNQIRKVCRETGQRVPESPGEVIRVALESVAMRYRWILKRLRILTGRRLTKIHIVGGGIQNTLLNQLAATICEAPVYAGPVEATSLGNLAVQMRATGVIGSLAEAAKFGGEPTLWTPGDLRPYEPLLEVFDSLTAS